MKKRVSDIVIDFLADHGITDIFMVSGGASMFLTDSLASNPRMHAICCHGEGAAGNAAVAYAKYKGNCACFTTSGCGATNTVTSVLNAWQDSISCFFISGQAKTSEMTILSPRATRQLGLQEANVAKIMSSITKASISVSNPEEILFFMESAYFLSTTGRPGPVFIEIPINVQDKEVETVSLSHFNEFDLIKESPFLDENGTKEIENRLRIAKKPVILAGHGISLAGMKENFNDLVNDLGVPVVYSRLGIDLIPSTNQYVFGQIGTMGTMTANTIIQNADFVLVLGCRLSVCTIGYTYSLFAANADVWVLDIDKDEHQKGMAKIDRFFHADLRDFLGKKNNLEKLDIDEWRCQCWFWKKDLAMLRSEHLDDKNGVSIYALIDYLSYLLESKDTIVTDTGSSFYVTPQVIKLTESSQRFITSSAQTEMGCSLPSSVGVAVASGSRVICITGDGGFQFNIQELQTIIHNNLNVKIIVLNNGGYRSIREAQGNVFKGRYLGVGPESGVSFPNLAKIAYAYSFNYFFIGSLKEVSSELPQALNCKSPAIIEVFCIKDEPVIKVISGRALDMMVPANG